MAIQIKDEIDLVIQQANSFMSVQNANPDDFLEEILNFEGLMKVINEQTKDHGGVDRKAYDWATTYFQEAQNDLRPQSYHS